MKKILVMVLVALFASSVIAQAASTIKLGFAHVFSGPMKTFGQVARQGAELAVKEINSAGGVVGQEIEIVYGNTAAKPAVALKSIQKLVVEDKVDMVIGIVSSAVAIKTAPLMNELKCPLIVTHAMAHQVTGTECNPWVFRITWNLDQCYKSAALLAKDLGPTKWTTIGPDYGFGQASWKYFRKYLSTMGAFTFDEGTFTPLATKDWKNALEKLQQSGSDGVMISLWGSNLRDFLRQAHREGFFRNKQVVCSVGGSVEIFLSLGFLRMPHGIWFGTPYWYEAYTNSYNDTFVEAYKRLSGAKIPPSYAAYNAYAAVKMFAAAVEKAKSTDKSAIAKALSGLTVTALPVGATTFRAGDHQAVFDVAFGRSAQHPAKGYNRIRGLDPIKRFPGLEVTLPVAETGCKMEPLSQ